MTPKYVAISMRLCNALLIPPPPPRKLSHRYATEVDSEIYDMGPLSHYMADDFIIPNPPLIVAYFNNKKIKPRQVIDNYTTLSTVLILG